MSENSGTYMKLPKLLKMKFSRCLDFKSTLTLECLVSTKASYILKQRCSWKNTQLHKEKKLTGHPLGDLVPLAQFNDTHRERLVFQSIQCRNGRLAASDLFHMFTLSRKFSTFQYQ